MGDGRLRGAILLSELEGDEVLGDAAAVLARGVPAYVIPRDVSCAAGEVVKLYPDRRREVVRYDGVLTRRWSARFRSAHDGHYSSIRQSRAPNSSAI